MIKLIEFIIMFLIKNVLVVLISLKEIFKK